MPDNFGEDKKGENSGQSINSTNKMEEQQIVNDLWRKSRFPRTIMIIAVVLTAGVLLLAGWSQFNLDKTSNKLTNRYIEALDICSNLTSYREKATLATHRTADTGKHFWSNRYFQVKSRLSSAIQKAITATERQEVIEVANKLEIVNSKLVEIELQIIELAREGKLEEAHALFSSQNHIEARESYTELTDIFENRIRNLISTQIAQNKRNANITFFVAGITFIMAMLAWIFVFKDIHQWQKALADEMIRREKANSELALSEQRFRAIANYTYAWEIWLGTKGEPLWTNPAVKRVTGYSLIECLHMKEYPQVLVYEKDRELFEKMLHSELLGDHGHQMELRVVRKDDALRWVSVSWQPIYDGNRKWQGIRASFVECDERKEAQELLAEKKDELEAILYAVAHDFRGPLINIEGFSHVLQENVDKLFKCFDKSKHTDNCLDVVNKDLPETLEMVHKNIMKFDHLLNGLLRVSRIEEPKPELIEDMDVLVGRAVNSFKDWIEEVSASFEVKPMPPCYADRAQVQEIFTQLISNALKFRSPDRKPEVTISGASNSRHCTYCVQDNGIGFESAEQKQLFKLFHRLEPEKTGGKGIGLVLASRLAHRNEGTIRAESNKGIGSKFFVTLPLKIKN